MVPKAALAALATFAAWIPLATRLWRWRRQQLVNCICMMTEDNKERDHIYGLYQKAR